jgi:hypothetical protein
VPVPGGSVYEDLAVFELAGDVKSGEGCDEGGDSEEEMDCVDSGDEVEEMAALIGLEEDVLSSEFAPGDPLTGEEEDAEGHGGGEPGECAASDGFAEAEPLVHDVVFAEHLTARELHRHGAEEEDGGVEPEDAGDDGGGPLVDVVVVGVDVAGGLIDEEGADDGDEEHQVTGEGEEDAHTVAVKTFVGAASAMGAIVPAFAIASAAGAFVGWWTTARTVVVIFESASALLVGFIRGDGGRHGGSHSEGTLGTDYSGLLFAASSIAASWTGSDAH